MVAEAQTSRVLSGTEGLQNQAGQQMRDKRRDGVKRKNGMMRRDEGQTGKERKDIGGLK